MYWFTADEHYGHFNIIRYCNRPFSSVEEMDNCIIQNHNAMVSTSDTVIHVGDFTLERKERAALYIKQLKGNHTFLQGSHDYWLKNSIQMWERTIEGIYVVAFHYAMRRWPKSHYGSIQVYGHSHGKLPPEGLQYDVGVDNNSFCPVSFETLKNIMKELKPGENIYGKEESR